MTSRTKRRGKRKGQQSSVFDEDTLFNSHVDPDFDNLEDAEHEAIEHYRPRDED